MSKVNDLSAYSSDQSSDTPANTEYMQSTKEKRALRIMPRIMHGHSFLPLSISLCCRGEVVVDDSPPRLFSLSRNGRFKLYASSSNPPNRSTRDAVPPPRNACYRFLVDTRQRIIAVGIAKTRKWEETSGYRGERERKDRPWWCAAVDVRGRRRTGGGDLFIDRRT